MDKPTSFHPLLSDIATFYRRWHALEESLGGDAIIDFDYCPPEFVRERAPFESRLAVLRTLDTLREALASAKPHEFCNHEHLTIKLEGSSAYVRALMGQRFAIQDYIKQTLGIDVEPVTDSELSQLREDAERSLSRIGIQLRKEDREKHERETVDPDVSSFGIELREIATRMVEYVRQELELEAIPDYTIQEVQEDAYWTNFVDGKLGAPLRLRFNTHPRKTYRKGLAFEMAAHEVAAHLINILELSLSAKRGKVDAAALNTTLHSCELYQMEGLAQSLIHLLDHPFEVSDFTAIETDLRTYHIALLQRAHLDIEGGKPVDEVLRWVLDNGPFLREVGVLSELRDRSLSPCFRTLIFVYHPSKKKFMEARTLSLEKRKRFLQGMYRELWTPVQIEKQLILLRGA